VSAATKVLARVGDLRTVTLVVERTVGRFRRDRTTPATAGGSADDVMAPRSVVYVLLAAAVLVGCGGDDDEPRRGVAAVDSPTTTTSLPALDLTDPESIFPRIAVEPSWDRLKVWRRKADDTLWRHRRDPRAFDVERRVVEATTDRLHYLGCD
jgi:hypothetical protein